MLWVLWSNRSFQGGFAKILLYLVGALEGFLKCCLSLFPASFSLKWYQSETWHLLREQRTTLFGHEILTHLWQFSPFKA